MPLARGSSKQAFSRNVATEMRAEKPQNQALAIAYRIKRQNRADGGEISDPMGEAYPPQGGNAVERTAGHLAQGVANWLGTPGRAVNEGLTPQEATDWGAGTALMMVGASRFPGGAPMGAVGAAGSKLIQPEGIRAFHGSPHDFDKFDLGKIGTGEGAQAYGHGLYFAENEGVARQYRDTLAPARAKMPDDVISMPPESRQAFMAQAGKTDVDPATAAKRAQYAASALRLEDPAKLASLIEQVRQARQGRMYEVNIGAKPEQFLDWDKPLAQMSPEVQSRLKDAWLAHPEAHARQTGEGIYGTLEAENWDSSKYRGAGKPAATRQLLEAGIPGIRYLDQGSRGAVNYDVGSPQKGFGPYSNYTSLADAQAQLDLLKKHGFFDAEMKTITPPQTSNYVVFDPGTVNIMRKYAIPGVGGAGAAALAASQSDGNHMAKGGSVNPALNVAYRVKREGRAMGGPSPASWQTRKEAGAMTHSGPIMSAVAGRTDHHPMNVAAGSYVLPADHVSSLGQGNTQSGMAVLGHMFGSSGPLGIGKAPAIKHGSGAPAAPRAVKLAKGGAPESTGEPVPINAAGGEFVIPPEVVAQIGGGDIKRGHSILDNWVVTNRKKHIKTLQKLPGPAKS